MGEAQHDLIALALMKAFLLAHPHHGAGVRAKGAATEWHLIGDRRAIHQPADGADIGPGQAGIVENAGVFRLARQQVAIHLVPAGAQRLRRGIEVEAMAGLVLNLGHQRGLAAQGRRAGQPVALWQHADILRMRMLADLSDQGPAVSRRHPILRLDLLLRIDTRLKAGFFRRGVSN